MTIQKIDVEFKNKKFHLILEDGLVSVLDPSRPQWEIKSGQPRELKITTMAGAKQLALQMIERVYWEGRRSEN